MSSNNTSANSKNKSFKEDKIDLGAIFAKYKRFWWLFVGSLIVCISCAALYIYVKKPIFLINAKVLISQDEGGSGMGASLMKSLSLGGGGSKVDDELVVMSAQSIRQEMVRQLKINRSYTAKTGLLKSINYYNDSPIEINAPDALFDTLTSSLKFKIEVNEKGDDINISVKKGMFKTLTEIHATSFPITVKTSYGTYVLNTTKFYKKGEPINLKATVTGNVIKAESFEKDLTVELVSKKSNGISLYINDTNIKRGKDIVNKLVELYNIRGQVEKDEMAVNTRKFINERLNLIYSELYTSESDIEKYKKGENFTDLGIEAEYLMRKKGSLENALFSTETQYSIIKMIRDFLASPKNKYSLVPFTAEFSNASDGIEEYNKLVLEKIKLENNAKGNNIVLKAINDQIDAMRSNLLVSINKTIESTQISLGDLRSKEAESLSKLGNIPTQEREFIQLRRQQSIKNELYTFLLKKGEENELVLAATTPKGKIVDQAFALSEPIAPSLPMAVSLALFFGIVIPFFILYIKALFTTRFSSQDELEEIIDIPVLGEVCHNRHSAAVVVRPGKISSIVELFRLIRNNIQFMLPAKDDKVILVTSSVSGEGKSFISANIAASFALLNKKVVLVGLDIRSPRLAEYMSLKATSGVTSFLSREEVQIDDIIQHYDINGLDVIVAGPVPPNPSELLLSPRVEELFSKLRDRYDYVIIDSAPIAMVSDTFSLAKFSNTIIYVTRADFTKRSFVKYLNNVVRKGQLSNVSAIINDTNPKFSHGYGYGYGDSNVEND
ncbi:MAG: polysaccharide biosynthesis tyrosine autokinase [Muribaculaceae bacterium]